MKKLLPVVFALLFSPLVLAQADPAGGADEGGISFKMIMNIVYVVMAVALLALGIWYFKLKKEND